MSKKQIAIQNISRSTKLNVDMGFLGSHLLRDHKAVSAVIRKLSPRRSFVSFLAQYGVSLGEVGSEAPGVTTGTISESLVRWRLIDSKAEALRIIDASQIPANIQVGKPYTITLNDNWLDPDAVLLSSNGTDTFIVEAKNPTLAADGVGCTYTISLVGPDPTQVVPNTMLNPTKYLNYIGNGKGERSSTSQELTIRQSSVDMFNVTQVMRHKISASGHALSTKVDDTQLAYLEMSQDGKTIEAAYGMPFGGRLISEHLAKVNDTLFFGRTNFDAFNRVVLSRRGSLGNTEIPLLAGIKQQMEYTDSVYEYNVGDSPEINMDYIEALMNQARNKFELSDGCRWILLTGNGGEAVLQDIMNARFKRDGVVRQQAFTPGQTTAAVGNKYGNTYVSQYGTFEIVNYGYAVKDGKQFDQVMYNGVAHDSYSFNIYLIPILPSTYYADGRRNIRLVTKSYKNINRGLVVGSIAGMSGLYGNGMDINLASMTNADAQFIRSVEGTKIASPVDGEELLALSEFSVVVENPDDIIWMKPKF